MSFECIVLDDNAFGLHDEISEHRGVSLQCFIDNQMFFAVLTHEAVEDRYHRVKLTREDGNLLVDGDLQTIGFLIAKKFSLGELSRFHSVGQHSYPLIVVNMADMKRIPEYVHPDTSLNAGESAFR